MDAADVKSHLRYYINLLCVHADKNVHIFQLHLLYEQVDIDNKLAMWTVG